MSLRKPIKSFSYQRGFTVVELLIAGVLGLVLLAGVGQLFLGSSQTFRLQRQVADIQDSGRFGVWFLKTDIEKAGWFNTNQPPEVNATVIVTADDDGGDDENDAITVSYEDPDSTLDCAGADSGGVIQNRYFVDDNRNLVCQGNGGGGAQPLVANVDSFQVLYGIDVPNPPEPVVADICSDRAVDQFVRASDLTGNEVIVAVRFAILLAGETNSSVPAQNRTYQVADRSIEFNDRIIRRVFSLTTPIQNLPPTGNCPEA